MDHRPQLSESGDDSDASDDSIDLLPPYFNCDGSKPEEIIQWKLQTVDSFKRSSEELKSEYDKNLPTLTDQIKNLKDFTDEIESVHKGTTVVSLIGASVGGVAAIAGLALAPITFGLAMCVTAVAAVAVVAGGVTSAASNMINILKQKNLRLTVEKIICDFLKTIKPMTEHLSIISNITEDIKQNNEILSKLQFQTPVGGFDDVLNTAKAADLALVGKYCAEASKEIRVYEKTVRAVCDPAQAARAKRVAATTGGLSSLFLALDVASIVQNLIGIYEMNQPANTRNPEEIKSQTRKFINHTRETASQFQETLDKIKHVTNTFS